MSYPIRYFIAIVVFIAFGIFFGFDEVFRAMGLKTGYYGVDCRDHYIRDMLVRNYVNSLSANLGLSVRATEHLHNGTRIRFSDFKERDETEKENRIYCKANFKAKNDAESLYFQSNGSVEYEIQVISKEKLEAMSERRLLKGVNLKDIVIEGVYIDWKIEKFERR